MNISYIYHSGFLVETTNRYCIFDYYRGALPRLNPDKPVVVFASHSHADHYNPEIFSLLAEQGMTTITAVLSKDIPERRWPSYLTPCPEENITDIHSMQNTIPTLKASFYKTYSLPHDMTIQTLHSTDRGVAFLVRCDGCVIYHAGDLNDWCWDETSEDYSEQYNRQMTGNYRHEIDLLRKWLGDGTLDAAFLPLDPRQGAVYDKGILYFLQKIPVKAVYPMHYWEQPEIIRQFLQENPSYRGIVRTK